MVRTVLLILMMALLTRHGFCLPVVHRIGFKVWGINVAQVWQTRHFLGANTNLVSEADTGVVDNAVEILYQDKVCVVVSKPPGVVCHHSEWSGSKRGDPEVPLLQRVRDTLGGRRVNLIHRLDRGASGCVVCAFADQDNQEIAAGQTAQLIEALQSANSTKTYVALVRGTGILHDRDLTKEGWFLVDRPIKDERGTLRNATTWLRFVAGQHDESTGARASLVLARPTTGRWHQIRRHLNGLSHPILGDTSHGSSHTNRQWRTDFGLSFERLCLHLARVELPATSITPPLDVACPLPRDMQNLLTNHLPLVWNQAKQELLAEGIVFNNEATPSLPGVNTHPLPPHNHTHMSSNYPVEILERGVNYVVVSKPPGIVCHNSKWTDSSSHIPMLQRVRDCLQANVNFIHRLDQSASGCLLLSVGAKDDRQTNVTRALIEALSSKEAVKTYVAITVGDIISPNHTDWFSVDNLVKDENGVQRESSTLLKFVAGNSEAAVVLARPQTGRWHQIRQHLRQIHHPILGDSTHGYSRTNREWIANKGALPQRTFLHLAHLRIPATEFTSHINVSSPLPEDMLKLLQEHLPEALDQLADALHREQISKTLGGLAF